MGPINPVTVGPFWSSEIDHVAQADVSQRKEKRFGPGSVALQEAQQLLCALRDLERSSTPPWEGTFRPGSRPRFTLEREGRSATRC
jgi:hypothetical protein